jgi:transcriptional regulator GlxA family with amidase domain
MKERTMTSTLIDIILYDGLDELDAVGPLEVFRRAAMLGGELEVRLVTRELQAEVRGAFGLGLAPDETYEPGAADIVVVPGGGWLARAEVGAWGECRRGHWLTLLALAASTARIIAGVCTGTLLLAYAGVVKGRCATTHRDAWSDLSRTGATVRAERVVDDGDLVTCGGVTSGIDLALWLVERECSVELAERVAGHMEYTRTRPPIGPIRAACAPTTKDDHARAAAHL